MSCCDPYHMVIGNGFAEFSRESAIRRECSFVAPRGQLCGFTGWYAQPRRVAARQPVMSTYRLDSGRSTAAGVVNLVGSVLALILATHIVLVLASANPDHPAVHWVARSAHVIAL